MKKNTEWKQIVELSAQAAIITKELRIKFPKVHHSRSIFCQIPFNRKNVITIMKLLLSSLLFSDTFGILFENK